MGICVLNRDYPAWGPGRGESGPPLGQSREADRGRPYSGLCLSLVLILFAQAWTSISRPHPANSPRVLQVGAVTVALPRITWKMPFSLLVTYEGLGRDQRTPYKGVPFTS